MLVSGPSVQNSVDLRRNLLDRGHAVDTADQPLRIVEREDGRRLRAIFLHAPADGLFVVIGPALEFGRRADVAYARHFSRSKPVVIAGAAPGAGETAGNPLDEGLLVDGELDHMVHLAGALAKQDLKRLGLSPGPREAVEDRSAAGPGVQAFADQRADDRVADQLAALHYFPRFE